MPVWMGAFYIPILILLCNFSFGGSRSLYSDSRFLFSGFRFYSPISAFCPLPSPFHSLRLYFLILRYTVALLTPSSAAAFSRPSSLHPKRSSACLRRTASSGRDRETYPTVKNVEISSSIEDAVRGADIVNVAASGKVYPRIEEDWLKPGVFVSLPAGIEMDSDFLISDRCRRVVDNWKMYEAWSEELTTPYWNIMGLIGTKYLDLIDDGLLTKKQIDNLGDITAGKIPGRKIEDEKILFGMGGMPVYDVAWGYQLLQNAKKLGLGTSLNLWEKPDLA